MDVLIVATDPDLRGLLADVLLVEGLHPHLVCDPAHSASFVQGLLADAGLIDMALGAGVDAVAVAHCVLLWSPRLPLVALSASPEERTRAEDAGVFAHVLDKPFGIDDVVAAVRQAAADAA